MDNTSLDQIKNNLTYKFGPNWSHPDYLQVVPFYLVKKRHAEKKGKGDLARKGCNDKSNIAEAEKKWTGAKGRGDAA